MSGYYVTMGRFFPFELVEENKIIEVNEDPIKKIKKRKNKNKKTKRK